MAQFFASFVNTEWFSGESKLEESYQYILRMIAHGKKVISENSKEIALATNWEELSRNNELGKISAFLTVEEGGILNGKIERLTKLHEEGIRLITLTWNHENCIGFPNSRDPELMQKGLKPFGVEVVERMNDLGMLIDVSHLSDGGFWDVLKISKKPFVASHSNARALRSHPRNLSDDMITALSEKGGIAGVNFYPYFLCESGKATAENIADHIVHMYRKGGEDFVAIGTDFDGFDDGELDVAHMGEMGKVYDAVKKRGLTERQMEKIWNGNAMRVVKEVLL